MKEMLETLIGLVMLVEFIYYFYLEYKLEHKK